MLHHRPTVREEIHQHVDVHRHAEADQADLVGEGEESTSAVKLPSRERKLREG